MATIKSYTDIEQSKKLAEILPLESADMYYFDDNGEEPKFKVRNGITYYYDSEDFLCCWSLAALLGVLPLIDFIRPILIGTPKMLYICIYNEDLKSHTYDNPVDACYEMILKLHEFKML